MTDVVSITYKGIEYTMRDLSDMPMAELIELHNDLAQEQELMMVVRFENRTIGMKRTWDRLLFSVPAPVQEQPAPAAEEAPVQERGMSPETIVEAEKEAHELYEALRPGIEAQGLPTTPKVGGTSARKKREMYFNFPIGKEIKVPRAGTLRAVVLEKLLAKGLTFDEVIEVVKKFDAERAAKGVDMKGADQNPERRAYEIVRIINYYLGYGLKHTDGVITAFDKKA